MLQLSLILVFFFILNFSLETRSGDLSPSETVSNQEIEKSVNQKSVNELEKKTDAKSEIKIEKKTEISINDFCFNALKKYKNLDKNNKNEELLKKSCKEVMAINSCKSSLGQPIFHLDKNSSFSNTTFNSSKKIKVVQPKNILVISLIHGDEIGAGSLSRYWMERLQQIDPRNNWRIIPVANPDGADSKTRTNANGVDLNRNFPTSDWESMAKNYWQSEAHSSQRKFPGVKAASEPEVNCILDHLKEFKPEFVISIHTPLSVLDFDGPKLSAPKFDYLPWKRLGNFPGSLGRLLWVEQQVPVLTAELKSDLPKDERIFDQLQDVIGQLVQKEFPSK